METDSAPLLVPDTPVGGRYRVQRLLGRWLIGNAYEAFDALDPERTALTLLTLRLAPGAVSRYLRWLDANTLRIEAVPEGLVTPVGGGHLAGDQGYLVVGRMRGRSLLHAIRADGPLTEMRAARLGKRIASVVASAHAAGRVLGGLRPTTVLLGPDDEGVPQLFDLGLERGLRALLATPPRPAPPYLAPDREEAPTASDDVFSAGALLYYMLTGETPPVIPKGTTAQVVTPPSWKRRDTDLTAYLDPVVLQAMAVRAPDRHPSAADLADALSALAEVYSLSPSARELLGLPVSRTRGFRRVNTNPHLLHDYLGLPAAADAEGLEVLESFEGLELEDEEED